MYLNIEEYQKNKKILEKTSESAHPMICLLFEVMTSYQENKQSTRMWANAQPDGRLAEHRWRPLFNAAKFG